MESRSYIFTLLSLGFLLFLTFRLSIPSSPGLKRNIASLTASKRMKALRQERIEFRPSPFTNSKVLVKEKLLYPESTNSSVKAAVSSSASIPAGTQLMAVIDNDCFLTKTPSSLSASAKRGQTSILKVQAYSLYIEQDVELEQLVNEAQSDECLVGLTDGGSVRADQLYEDPKAIDQKHLSSIKVKAGESFFFNSSLKADPKVVIAIVDSGVDYEHPDLAPRMWSNTKGEHGFDFVNDDTDPMDDNEHGTHVAGLAAAAGANSTGVSGVMPSRVEIMAVKILDDNGSGSYANVANGIRFAVDNGADVINISLSGGGTNAGVEDALVHALNNGVPVIVSAGNDDIELDSDDNARTPSSMGKTHEGVITVGATDSETSEKSPFSNHSSLFVEISAPGSNGILSTLPNNSFGNLNGTSMSTPIVTGAVALVIGALKKASYPYTPKEIERILLDGAIKNPLLTNSFLSGNQLNIEPLKTEIKHGYIAPLSGGIEDAF